MPIMYLALLVVLALLIWGSVVMVRNATLLATAKARLLAEDPDALQKRLIPLLAYVALVSILIKICVF